MQHITIYRAPERYAGWPANYGIWGWGDEIVVSFTLGYVEAGVPFHARDKNRPFQTIQSRSLDGGLTWTSQPFPGPTPGNLGLSADEHMNPHLQIANALDGVNAPQTCPGGINFTHPDFALMGARTGLRAGAQSWFYVSYDRCHHWEGPYWLPTFNQTGIAARTDYLVDGPESCTLLLTAAKPDGQEGRVFCARTTDGGKSFHFLSWVTPEPTGYTIMPASLRLPGGRILTAVRCREQPSTSGAANCWIDLYCSDDNGLSWQHRSRPVPDTGRGGNPPTMTRLYDGRLCITYGYRNSPFAIQAVISRDEGTTWDDPITLHTHAGNHDIGYPRSYLRPDGTLMTAYYFNDDENCERYIAATLWQP